MPSKSGPPRNDLRPRKRERPQLEVEQPERDFGFYWVKLKNKSHPIVAEWIVNRHPRHRPYWQIPGSEDILHDDDISGVVEGPIKPTVPVVRSWHVHVNSIRVMATSEEAAITMIQEALETAGYGEYEYIEADATNS